MVLQAVTTFTLPASAYAPLAVGFFGLGVGYLIYGPGELFGFPARGRAADIATGVWGFWMPGFMQLFASLPSSLAERALGAVRILTGLWLIYLTWAVALNLSSGFKLWV